MTENKLRLLMAESIQKCHKAIFDNYCNYVYAIVINILRSCSSKEDIEDCVSEIFMKIYKMLDNNTFFSGDIKGFIAAVSRNTAIDAFRRLNKKNFRSVYIDDEKEKELIANEKLVENTE